MCVCLILYIYIYLSSCFFCFCQLALSQPFVERVIFGSSTLVTVTGTSQQNTRKNKRKMFQGKRPNFYPHRKLTWQWKKKHVSQECRNASSVMVVFPLSCEFFAGSNSCSTAGVTLLTPPHKPLLELALDVAFWILSC